MKSERDQANCATWFVMIHIIIAEPNILGHPYQLLARKWSINIVQNWNIEDLYSHTVDNPKTYTFHDMMRKKSLN